MQEHGVPCGGHTAALSSNWLEDTPEGDHFVGSYGRVFDVIAAAISSPRWFPVAAQAQRHDDRD